MGKRRVQARSDWRFTGSLAVYAALCLAVLAVYGQTLHFDFVNYDDPDYVTANAHTSAGLTWQGWQWAFTTGYAGNWFPITWLSHMLDCELFGLDSGWHHFTNVWLHAASACLLFALLKRWTGAMWRSALVASLFALHPLHVESVAWVSERKDVLSALFLMVTLWAYTRYTEKPGSGRYAAMVAALALGLMSKPMLVTAPLVMVLLDYWPLRRGLRLKEKVLPAALSAAVAAVTLVVHRQAGATASLELVPPAMRVENAVIATAVYLVKWFWPSGLAVFYPYARDSLVAPAAAAAAALLGISFVVWREARRRPYLVTGWLWYLITLAPVIGIVQVGAQARADRYTYIPMIGLSVALVWAGAELLKPWPAVRTALGAGTCAACAVLAYQQVGYWHDGVSLFRRAAAVTSDNFVAHFNLASLLDDEGKAEEAAGELREVVRIRPAFAKAHAELGQLLAKQGREEESLRELQLAVRLAPEDGDAHYRLGSVLGSLGRPDQAIPEFATAARLRPENGDAHFNLGLSLAMTDRIDEAEKEFREAVRLKPADAQARYNLGIALATLGQRQQAVAELTEAVRLAPQFGEARQALDDAMRLPGR